MKLYEVNGTYGSGKTPCTVFVAEGSSARWYVVNGSVNVNKTWDQITNGVDVEQLRDLNMFTASYPINSLGDLQMAIEE